LIRLWIGLAALVAGLALYVSLQPPTFAASLETTYPHPFTLRRQTPELNGASASSESSSAGGKRSGISNPLPTYGAPANMPAVDPHVEMQEMRALIRLAAREAVASAPGRSLPGFAVPSLSDFIAQVKTNQPGILTGVYVPGILALWVLPSRANDPLHVTRQPVAVTNSCGISRCPSTGLLAHNSSSGALFFQLSPNQEVDMVFGDGSIQRYRITSIRHFQALSPLDPYSSFMDLDTRSAPLSSTDVFMQTFGVANRVVFQTCIAADGQPTWGRLFVIAEPM
jgi:hypothetical protein